MPVHLVGRTTNFSGKRLYDYLSKLKDWGVGRVVYRNVFFERYPEKSYYVITRVQPFMMDRMDKYNKTEFGEACIRFNCFPYINVYANANVVQINYDMTI